MNRDHFAGCADRGADGDHLYRTPAPDGAPTSAEIVANAAEVAFAGDPFDALRSIELTDPPVHPLRDPLGVIRDPYASWLAGRCLAPSPSTNAIVCILDAGHAGAHRTNPIPAMEWGQ